MAYTVTKENLHKHFCTGRLFEAGMKIKVRKNNRNKLSGVKTNILKGFQKAIFKNFVMNFSQLCYFLVQCSVKLLKHNYKTIFAYQYKDGEK